MLGSMEINGIVSNENDFTLFENKDGIIKIDKVSSDSKFIVLSGEPLDEPTLAAGPFVMNTAEELKQAAKDYREGNFGTEDF